MLASGYFTEFLKMAKRWHEKCYNNIARESFLIDAGN